MNINGLIIPISRTYVISVVYTSISSNEVSFISEETISGIHATKSEIPDITKNRLVPFVISYLYFLSCKILIVCNFVKSKTTP